MTPSKQQIIDMRLLLKILSFIALLLTILSMTLPYTKIVIRDSSGYSMDKMYYNAINYNRTGFELQYPLISPIIALLTFLCIHFLPKYRFLPFILASVNALSYAVIRILFDANNTRMAFEYKPAFGFYIGLTAAALFIMVSVVHWKSQSHTPINDDNLLDTN